MDRRLHEACLRGDLPTFAGLIHEDGGLLDQRTDRSANTVLHLASRMGHVELVAEIMKLRPRMAMAENVEMETPVHDACREGRSEVVGILMEADPWNACRLNRHGESALSVACSRGHVRVVRQLLSSLPSLLGAEEDGSSTALHAAASGGFTEIVKEILEASTESAWKRNGQGQTALHLAASKGHLEICRELMRVVPDLVDRRDEEGRAALHSAAIRGRVSILNEILSACGLDAAHEAVTNHGETVLHLSVRNNQHDAVRYMVEHLCLTRLPNMRDRNGNTALHLATAGRSSTMARLLLKRTDIDVNALNFKGQTALDLVASDNNSSGALLLLTTLDEAGAKRSTQLRPPAATFNRLDHPSAPHFHLDDPPNHADNLSTGGLSTSISGRLVDDTHHHCQPRRTRRRRRQLRFHREGLLSARDNIAVIAVLIASVSFTAGINPPGGVFQEGPLVGKSTAWRSPAYRVFMLSNHVALFSSLGIVLVLVTVIPFQRRSMKRLLAATHKVMWVAASFMAIAFVAGMWVILPPSPHSSRWVLASSAFIGGGSMAVVLVGLSAMLARHYLRKLKWKLQLQQQKKVARASPQSSKVYDLRTVGRSYSSDTGDSDLDSSGTSGCVTY